MNRDRYYDEMYTEAVKLTAKSIFDIFKDVNGAALQFIQTVDAHDTDTWKFVDAMYGRVYCTDVSTECADARAFKAFVPTTYAVWVSVVDTAAFPCTFTDRPGYRSRYMVCPFKEEFDNDVVCELEKMFKEADIELNGSIGIEHDFEYSPASTDFVIYFEIDLETEGT